MKQTILLGAVLLLILASLGGCAYSNVKLPYDLDLDKTTFGDKVGKAHFQSILGLVAWGDAGTKAAAENGNITIAHHMDRESLVILFGTYYKHTTIVYGE